MVAELRLAQGSCQERPRRTGTARFFHGRDPAVATAKTASGRSAESPAGAVAIRWACVILSWRLSGLFLLASGDRVLDVRRFWRTDSVALPDVIGKQIEVARSMLEREDLALSVSRIASEGVRSGGHLHVAGGGGQCPGTHRMIHLTISRGGSISWLDLTGLTVEQAREKLKSIHLRPGQN